MIITIITMTTSTIASILIIREGTVVACVRQLWFAGQRGISSVF